jgi:predicted transcriptional regulator
MIFDRKKLLKDIQKSGLRKGFIVEKSGIHRSYLWMIIKGLREPSQEVLKRIYSVLIGDVR